MDLIDRLLYVVFAKLFLSKPKQRRNIRCGFVLDTASKRTESDLGFRRLPHAE